MDMDHFSAKMMEFVATHVEASTFCRNKEAVTANLNRSTPSATHLFDFGFVDIWVSCDIFSGRVLVQTRFRDRAANDLDEAVLVVQEVRDLVKELKAALELV